MKKDLHNLPLRSGVGIVVLNKENKVFVAKRIDNPKNFWQMPQGGVDEGEDYITAMKRELLEETSIQNIEIIKEIDKIYQYELPENLVGIIWKGKYRGQKQKWFITRFLGEEKEINLNTKHAEFIDWKWIEPKFLPEVIVNFKKDLYLNDNVDTKEWDKAIEKNYNDFDETIRFNNVYNRMICYNTFSWHGAMSTNAGDDDRLTLVFFIRGLHAGMYPLSRVSSMPC